MVAKGRGNVALRIYQSPESARHPGHGPLRGPAGPGAAEPDGLAYWAGVVVKKGDLALAVNLAASPEYANRAVTRFP